MDDIRNRFAWLRRLGQPGNESPEFTPAPPAPTESGELVREGRLVELRFHIPQNRGAFQRWYADDEIARLLRHDQRPLSEIQSRSYFDTLIMPSSARGQCFAIHERATGRLIGTTALTDFEGTPSRRAAYFRIVIGEKEFWGHGYGTEATGLMMEEAFGRNDVSVVKLEVFRHNERAERAYLKVGFEQTGEHIEWVGRDRWELFVLEMQLTRDRFLAIQDAGADISLDTSVEE